MTSVKYGANMTGSGRPFALASVGVAAMAIALAATVACADCWYLLSQNCCSLIIGPNQTRKCGETPCPDLLMTNLVVTIAYSGPGQVLSSSQQPTVGCVYQVRYCDQDGMCQTGATVSANCHKEIISGNTCSGGT